MKHVLRAVFVSRALALIGVAVSLWACQENLPDGPPTFTATMSMSAWPDTLIVGDVKPATVKTLDTQSREVLGLEYLIRVADTSFASFAFVGTNPNTGAVTGRKTGTTSATITLIDNRFVVSPLTKSIRVVVGGVSILSAHDTTLTAINDTATAVAASVIKVSGANAYRAGQGVRWVHLGNNVAVIGTADTIRYVARTPGVDTLIATHDYCLAGAQCADTLYARVVQTLRLSLSSKSFAMWSFADTVGPTVTLTDRRGTGNAQASVRLVPLAATDSARVQITAASFGTTNGLTGVMATKRVVSISNGTARVAVIALNPSGTTAGTDTITCTVRQLAARTSVEPLVAQITETDTIPLKVTARDQRGFLIADATFTFDAGTGLAVTGGKLSVTTAGTSFAARVLANVTGDALYSNYANAPARMVAIDTANVTVLAALSYTADANRAQNISLTLKTPGGGLLTNRWVRLLARSGGALSADSVQTDASGTFAATWTPPTTSGRYYLTAIVLPSGAYGAITDSSGLIVVRETATITAGAAAAATSTLAIDTTTFSAGDVTTVRVTVRDASGNLVLSAVPTDVTFSVSGGTLGAVTCANAVCSATFTAITAGIGSVDATIGGTSVASSPSGLTITAGAPTTLYLATTPLSPLVQNSTFARQPLLQILDAYGNLVDTNTFVVTASASDLVGVPTLGGTKVVSSTSGTVTYTNLAFATGNTGDKFAVLFTATDGTTTLTVKSSLLTNP